METIITKLSMQGFKSFNRRVSIPFLPGVNAIAGPNGSGKSNILDAVAFVLGRTSAKSLRFPYFFFLLFFFLFKGKKLYSFFVIFFFMFFFFWVFVKILLFFLQNQKKKTPPINSRTTQ